MKDTKDKIYLEKSIYGWQWHRYTYSKSWYGGACPHKHHVSYFYRTREQAREAKRNNSIVWNRI